MDLKTAVANGIGIEILAGHIYFQLQKLFADDREASSGFGTMGAEEEQHAAILRNCSGLIGSTPVASMPIDEAIRHTQKALIDRLHEISREIDTHPPTLDEAMRTSVQIEEQVEKAHARTVVNLLGTKGMLTYVTVAVEAISSLDNPDHGAALYDLARKRGIVEQDVEKVRQRRSLPAPKRLLQACRIAQRLNVQASTPHLFARYGLAGRPFQTSCVASSLRQPLLPPCDLQAPHGFFNILLVNNVS